MSSETTTYGGGRNLNAGWISTEQRPLAADTYFIGMLLEYNATNDNYEALTSGTLAGIYNGTDGRVLASAGEDNVIVAGEISEEGLVDATGVALTLTEDQRALFRDAGFYMKRN